MKAHRLYLAAGAVAVVAAAITLLVTGPEALAVMAWLVQPQDWHHSLAQLAIVAPLATLRTQHADLIARAKAKEGELKDGMAEADITRIKGEHETLVREAEDLQRQITAGEAAEREAQARSEATPANVQQAVGAAVTVERQRAASIRDIGTRAGLEAAVVQTAIDDGTAVDAFRVRAFDALAERSRQAPTSSVQASNTRDERDTLRRGMADAIVARLARASGERNVQIPEHARRYGEMGFAEMAAEAIGHRGHLRTARHVVEVLERAFHSTSDFPAIFSDALNVRLLARYQMATPTYRRFCAPYTTVDFRTTNVVRAGDFPSLQPVLETGEIKAGTFSESKEQLAVKPYGVRFGLSRQMIVNDNLGAINQVLGSAGDRVMDWENVQAFALLTSNSNTGPTLLTDNVVMFHDDHGNETASGTAINIASVSVGRAQMMKQTSLDGLKLNLVPMTILTGPDRLTDAEQLVASINPALIASAQPDWVRRLTPVGDANIGDDDWYLFADPSVAPCFVYGNLQGFEGPRLSTDDPFTVQGIEIKLEHDFGLAGVDFRGATHNAGAAPT